MGSMVYEFEIQMYSMECVFESYDRDIFGHVLCISGLLGDRVEIYENNLNCGCNLHIFNVLIMINMRT